MAPKLGYLLPTREHIMQGHPEAAPLLALAERAEALGYASVWVGDSLLARPRHEPLTLLAGEGRHYTLLFSHEFAQSFWRTGAQMSFMVPGVTYHRINGHGEVVQVTRKPFTRRTIKADVWKYHLQQMAAAVDPIAYLCRFLPAEDQDALRDSQPEPMVAQA